MKNIFLHVAALMLTVLVLFSCNDLDEEIKYKFGYSTDCTWFSINDSSYNNYYALSDIVLGPDSNQIVYLKSKSQEKYTAIYSSILVEDEITKVKKYVNSTAILDEKGLLRSISYDKYDIVFNYKVNKTVSMCLIDTFKIISLVKDVKTEIDFTNIEESVLHSFNTNNNSRFWQDLVLTDSIIKIFSNELIDKIPNSSNYLKSFVHYINSVEPIKQHVPMSGDFLTRELKEICFQQGSSNALKFSDWEPIEKAEKAFFFNVKTNDIYKTDHEYFSIIEYAGIDYMRIPKSTFRIQMGINICDTLKNPCDPFYESWNSIPLYNISENDYSTETKTYILGINFFDNKKIYKYSTWLRVDRFKVFGEVKTITID